MKQSQLFTKTRREAPKDDVSKNAQLLIRGGFIHKEIAGVYSYLPLGLKVLNKIQDIIREEMNKIGGQEVFMTTLQSEELWKKSGRWDDEVVDDWFKTELKNGKKVGLAFTHEEALSNILRDHVSSYKDLPLFIYQIQTKFRNELRAKSGIIRGREFPMKDMYSFTANQGETDAFHEKVQVAYMNIFNRVGIGDNTFLTISSGGSFSKYSHEFQTLSEAGEDTVHLSREKKIAINDDDYGPEILKDFNLEDVKFEKAKSIEVGDIYKLGTKFSNAVGLKYKDEKGENVDVDMGSYGIGVSRLMGTVVEVLSDEKGIVWPKEIAPFSVHLIEIGGGDTQVKEYADRIYMKLKEKNIEVLYDDRETRAGEKFADSDLIGIPIRMVVSKKTIEAGKVETVDRKTGKVEMVTEDSILE